jgi:hypothetical protein
MLLAEKAFPEDDAWTKRDKGAHSSLSRCIVVETRDDTAE